MMTTKRRNCLLPIRLYQATLVVFGIQVAIAVADAGITINEEIRNPLDGSGRHLQTGSEEDQCYTVCESNITQVLEEHSSTTTNEVIRLRFLKSSYAWFSDIVAPKFEILKGGTVEVEFVDVPLSQLSGDILNEATSQIGLYDGFLTPPAVSGSVVEYDGWADLTDYINESADHTADWADILLGYRQNIAQYEGKVIMFPLDGDILSLFYRKDILKHFGFNGPPRTWDEYEQIAAATHGQTYENKTLVGSCVARSKGCAGAYWANLLLASLTQTQGPWEGHLFDTDDMKPLAGAALEQVIKWLEMQVKYGPEGEFEGCITAVNFDYMKDEKCVLTYNWGNSFKRYLQEGDQLLGRFGVAPTPGSTVVLDRETMDLVSCNKDRCKHGDYYEDIGWVNRAPYMAFGGWACAVNNFTDPVKKRLATEFCAFASSKEESITTIIPPARGEHTGGQDPYRRSHLDVDYYVEQGYEREVAQDFITAIEEGLESPNVVADIRFPKASDINAVLDTEIHARLNATKYGLIDPATADQTRMELVKSISRQWEDIIETHNEQGSTKMSILESYQRLRGVFTQDYDYNQIDRVRFYGFVLAGLVVASSIGFATWTLMHQSHSVVKASQPFFLVMICSGTLVLGCAIFPLAIDDSIANKKGLDIACMSIPWLIALGWTIVFSALFAKLWRLNRVLDSAANFRRITITNKDVMWPFCILFGINVTLLLVWTLADPLYWDRIWTSETSSYGTCNGDGSSSTWKIMISLIGVTNFCALALANYQAYKGRKVATEFNESTYISLIMMSFLQLVLVGLPTLFLVYENPTASFFMRSSIIFVLCMAVLLFMFVPKMIAWREKLKSGTRSTMGKSYVSGLNMSNMSGTINGSMINTNISRPNSMYSSGAMDDDTVEAYKNKVVLLRVQLEKSGVVDIEKIFEEVGLDKDDGTLTLAKDRNPISTTSRTTATESCTERSMEQNLVSGKSLSESLVDHAHHLTGIQEEHSCSNSGSRARELIISELTNPPEDLSDCSTNEVIKTQLVEIAKVAGTDLEQTESGTFFVRGGEPAPCEVDDHKSESGPVASDADTEEKVA